MKIESVMTPHPYTLNADATLDSAKHQMSQHGIRHLPVLEGGKLIGIISDRDIKLAFAIDGEKAAKTSLRDSCTSEVYAVQRSEPLSSVAKNMGDNAIGCTIILDGNKVVGIFTAVDACKVLAQSV